MTLAGQRGVELAPNLKDVHLALQNKGCGVGLANRDGFAASNTCSSTRESESALKARTARYLRMAGRSRFGLFLQGFRVPRPAGVAWPRDWVWPRNGRKRPLPLSDSRSDGTSAR